MELSHFPCLCNAATLYKIGITTTTKRFHIVLFYTMKQSYKGAILTNITWPLWIGLFSFTIPEWYWLGVVLNWLVSDNTRNWVVSVCLYILFLGVIRVGLWPFVERLRLWTIYFVIKFLKSGSMSSGIHVSVEPDL